MIYRLKHVKTHISIIACAMATACTTVVDLTEEPAVEAAEALPFTEQEMTSEQIAEGKLLVREWEPNSSGCKTAGNLVGN